MSMLVYQMAVTAEHGLATKTRRAAWERRTRQGRPAGSRRRVGTLVVAIVVGVQLLGIGVAADEAAAWGGSGGGLGVGTARSAARHATTHQRQATAMPRYGGGGGTLATRR